MPSSPHPWPGAGFRYLLGRLLGLLIFLWTKTWRVVIEGEAPGIESPARSSALGPRAVFAFFHGQQLALLCARRTAEVLVMVSHSRDGDIQAGVMRTFGLEVVRGSGSRGGSAALRQVIRRTRQGRGACFAVDGPRGPHEVAKNGAALTAVMTDAELVPVATASSRSTVLVRAWDRFEVPWPFATVAIVIERPIDARSALEEPGTLDQALQTARARARILVKHRRLSQAITASRASRL